MLRDEPLHHCRALGKIEIDYFHSMAAHELGCTGKGAAFADDHFRNSKLHHRATAKVTGHEGGIENGVAKAADATGVAQTIDLRVGHGIILLHPLVMSDR